MSNNQHFWKKYHKENDKPYAFTSEIRKVIKDLDIESVLEIGCGYGNNLETFEGKKVVGLDLSEYAIKEARIRYPHNQFHVGSVLDIPSKEQFDLVFTSAVIEHIKPELLTKAFDEMFRVSKRYILNIEAYDTTEHEINWHRGRNEFWTIHMSKRWSRYPVKIMLDYDVHPEYRLTLASKL